LAAVFLDEKSLTLTRNAHALRRLVRFVRIGSTARQPPSGHIRSNSQVRRGLRQVEMAKMSERRRRPGAALFYRDQPAFEYESFALLSRRIGEDESRRRLAEFMREARLLLDETCAGSARGDMNSLKASADGLK